MDADELIAKYLKLKTKWIRQVKSGKATEKELRETELKMLELAEKERDREAGLR